MLLEGRLGGADAVAEGVERGLGDLAGYLVVHDLELAGDLCLVGRELRGGVLFGRRVPLAAGDGPAGQEHGPVDGGRDALVAHVVEGEARGDGGGGLLVGEVDDAHGVGGVGHGLAQVCLPGAVPDAQSAGVGVGALEEEGVAPSLDEGLVGVVEGEQVGRGGAYVSARVLQEVAPGGLEGGAAGDGQGAGVGDL